jgi:hypothetical protein
MGMTKTTTVTSITVTPTINTAASASTNNGNPTMTVWTNINIDDPTDDQLPIVYNGPAITLSKYTADASGSYVVPTNVTGSLMETTGSALVVSIANAIWSY